MNTSNMVAIGAVYIQGRSQDFQEGFLYSRARKIFAKKHKGGDLG